MVVVFIRKGSHHSKESREKIRKNHWSKSDNTKEIIEKIVIANIDHIPWNKGKKMTSEYCENVKLHHSRDIPVWNKGKTGVYSEETLEKMSVSHKGKPTWNKGGHRTWETAGFSGKSHSEETKQWMSLCRKGPKNANWHGGTSFEPYCFKFDETFKEYIRNKFNRSCFICGITEENYISDQQKKQRLYIHHIDYNKNDLCNGKSWSFIPLCPSCHSKTNFNRWLWFNKYINYWIYDYINFSNTFNIYNY